MLQQALLIVAREKVRRVFLDSHVAIPIFGSIVNGLSVLERGQSGPPTPGSGVDGALLPPPIDPLVDGGLAEADLSGDGPGGDLIRPHPHDPSSLLESGAT